MDNTLVLARIRDQLLQGSKKVPMSEIELTTASCVEHDAAASSLSWFSTAQGERSKPHLLCCRVAMPAMLAEADRLQAMPVPHLQAHGQTAPQRPADHWTHLHDVTALLQAGPQAS